jgi:hypothetical protein
LLFFFFNRLQIYNADHIDIVISSDGAHDVSASEKRARGPPQKLKDFGRVIRVTHGLATPLTHHFFFNWNIIF